jgi:hypothetical protein
VAGPDHTIVAAEGSAEHEQVVLLLSLAKVALSDASEVHTGILQAVYRVFTGGQGAGCGVDVRLCSC